MFGEFFNSAKETFKDWNFADIAKGVGALAAGYGGYRQAKSQEKMYDDQMNYMKSRDTRYDAVEDANQESIETAFNQVFAKDKKKKKDTTTASPTLENAYGTASTQVV